MGSIAPNLKSMEQAYHDWDLLGDAGEGFAGRYTSGFQISIRTSVAWLGFRTRTKLVDDSETGYAQNVQAQ